MCGKIGGQQDEKTRIEQMLNSTPSSSGRISLEIQLGRAGTKGKRG